MGIGSQREASEEIAGFENRLSGIESDVKLLEWMMLTHGASVGLSDDYGRLQRP